MFSKKQSGDIVTVTFMAGYKFRIESGKIMHVKGLTSTGRSSKNFAENLHNYLLLLAADNSEGFMSVLDEINFDEDTITRDVLLQMYERHSAVSTRLNGISNAVWAKIRELLHK